MKKASFLAMIAIAGLAATGFAQTNAGVSLLDSPYKIEAETSAAGETVSCSALIGGGSASAFGVDQIMTASPAEFICNELFGTYRVFHFDEGCSVITTWFTAFPGPTATGITYDEGTATTYWNLDPFGSASILEFGFGSGLPTGGAAPVPSGFPGVWGPAAIDTNQPGSLCYMEDIAADWVVEVDLVSGGWGCSFGNPDNTTGSGAYGNGISDAKDPSACSGATLAMSSGSIGEGQVTRLSQLDCSGTLCYNTWEIQTPTAPTGEFFPNGVEEFVSPGGGDKRVMVWGNVTGIMFNIGKPLGINDCQGVDSPDSDVVYANGSQGNAGSVVAVDNTAPLGMAIQDVPTSGGKKYVVHMNLGTPSGGTLTALPASLGTFCFPLLIPPFGSASPEAVWNNLGKTNKIGASTYFGVGISNPAKAPTFFHTDADGDVTNLPLGSDHTVQGIILNGASTSPKNASVTNALIVSVTAGL